MRLIDILATLPVAAKFLRHALTLPGENSIPLAARLAQLPRDRLPLKAAVRLAWDEHQIPFIEAENDEDLAVALGLVHVHLRWTQIELMRRIARGRLAEMAGPLALPLDIAIRTLGIARAVPDIHGMLPDDTRRWLAGFVAGINAAIERLPELPPDMRALGLGREPWTEQDVLSVGRVAGVDITWFAFIGALGAPDQQFARAHWRRLVGLEPEPGDGAAGALVQTLRANGRLGSNSFALAAARGASNTAWIASDPHLGATLPNLWLAAAYRSPSYQVAGLMIPGVPMTALGRNPHIGWGGTNLHAMSSDLFDVSDVPDTEIGSREETIAVRGGKPRTVTVRDTAYGPIVSDLSFFPGHGRKLALRWVGHGASDELTAMLRVNRATGWGEFKDALDGFAIPGQNMVYADARGRVGKLIAAHLPMRAKTPPETAVLPRAQHRVWRTLATARDLPAVVDPPSGYVASANENPGPTPVPVGWFFSTRTRIDRFATLLGGIGRYGLDEISRIQRDVAAPNLLSLRDLFVAILRALEPGPEASRLQVALAQWDGAYAEDSPGALAFELVLLHVGRAMLGPRFPLYARSWNTRTLIEEDIAALEPAQAQQAMRAAVPAAAKAFDAFKVWGAMHRLSLPHPAARIPVLGARFRFGDWPVGGNSETILKSGGPLTDRRHFAGLVAVARHAADMGDLDANYVALLGGQDGWLGSTTLLDQVAHWRAGTFIKIPLRPEGAREHFAHRTDLAP